MITVTKILPQNVLAITLINRLSHGHLYCTVQYICYDVSKNICIFSAYVRKLQNNEKVRLHFSLGKYSTVLDFYAHVNLKKDYAFGLYFGNE